MHVDIWTITYIWELMIQVGMSLIEMDFYASVYSHLYFPSYVFSLSVNQLSMILTLSFAFILSLDYYDI